MTTSLTDRLIADKVREQRDALIASIKELREVLNDRKAGLLTDEDVIANLAEVLDDVPWYVS